MINYQPQLVDSTKQQTRLVNQQPIKLAFVKLVLEISCIFRADFWNAAYFFPTTAQRGWAAKSRAEMYFRIVAV